jgi:hypothetical protein
MRSEGDFSHSILRQQERRTTESYSLLLRIFIMQRSSGIRTMEEWQLFVFMARDRRMHCWQDTGETILDIFLRFSHDLCVIRGFSGHFALYISTQQ